MYMVDGYICACRDISQLIYACKQIYVMKLYIAMILFCLTSCIVKTIKQKGSFTSFEHNYTLSRGRYLHVY